MTAAVALALATGAAGWIRHTRYWSGALDLGVFDQAAWQLAHGRTEVSLLQRSIFADHFSLVLVLFAPLYRLAATPAWLIGAQAVAIGLTVLPMRALARDLDVSVRLATVLVCASAPLLTAAMFDFHPSTLAVPLIATTVLFVQRDETRGATLAAAGVALCRADLAVVLFGLAVVASPRVRWRLLAVGVVGTLVGAVVPDLLGNPGAWTSHFSHLGDGPVDLALHPWRLVLALVERPALEILADWLIPVGLLVILKPRWTAALVVAALPVLVSSWPGTKLPWFHYGAQYMPIAVGGTLVALACPGAVISRIRPATRLAVPLVGTAVGLLLLSPLSPRAPGTLRLTRVVQVEAGSDPRGALAEVGEREVVSGDSRLVAHLVHRDQAYLFPVPFAELTSPYPPGHAPAPDAALAREVDVVVIAEREWADLPAAVLAGFDVVAHPDGFVVLRRR